MEFGKCRDCGALTYEDYGVTDSDHEEWHKRLDSKLAELIALIKGENK